MHIIQEEIGIKAKPSQLKKVFIFKKSIHLKAIKLWEREFHHVFLFEWNGNPKKLKLQEAEVEEIAFKPINWFEKQVLNKKTRINYVEHGLAYYSKLIKAFKKELF